ncbi:putative importin subunit beta-4 [Fusarium oxysporum f. sp. albedinis]|nr:putative importin subunit beta-4 [Fusarium oxysporum f. sp. albedinis]
MALHPKLPINITLFSISPLPLLLVDIQVIQCRPTVLFVRCQEPCWSFTDKERTLMFTYSPTLNEVASRSSYT